MSVSEQELRRFAAEIRLETLVELKARGFGHVGGAMSIVETLAVLYGDVMRLRPENPQWPERDWLVLSKGHAGPALYAALALKGYFDLEELKTLNQPGTRLPSHCDRLKTPGIDMTTGSLGQGISTAIGAALGNRLQGRDSYVYCIAGDGELDEGQIWEGALAAAQFKLDHMVLFVDHNQQQLDGYLWEVMDLGDICAKFASFGWHTQQVNGHDVTEIRNAIRCAQAVSGQPSVIVLETKKGKGCTFAEGVKSNHHVAFTAEQIDEAIAHARQALEEVS